MKLVKYQVRDQVGFQVRDKVWEQVRIQVWNQVRDQVKDQVNNQVYDQVWDQVKNQKLKYFDEAFYGRCDDLYWISFYDYFNRIGIVKHKSFIELKELFKCGIFTSIQLEGICFVSKPPIFLLRDEKNNMHNVEDAAIAFNDGFKIHYVHGVYFNEEDFLKYVKTKPTPKQVLSVKNAEQRGVLIKLYGYDYILDHLEDKKILDVYEGISKQTGKPVKYEVIEFPFEDNLIARFVKVECHTEHKITCLGVPRINETESCKGAIAWTFGLNEGDYNPKIET